MLSELDIRHQNLKNVHIEEPYDPLKE